MSKLALQTTEVKLNHTSIDQWHNRFGHVSKNYLIKMFKDHLVHGMKLNPHDELSFCHGCNLGNIKSRIVRKKLDADKADIFQAKLH